MPYAKVVTEADYNCKCKAGFEGNGFVCKVFVDPCADTTCKDGEVTNVSVTSYGQKVIIKYLQLGINTVKTLFPPKMSKNVQK